MMQNPQLAKILRERAEQIRTAALNSGTETDPFEMDSAELHDVLARILEGKPITRAFGAPGDWGYNTPIGDALAKGWQ